VKRHTRRYHGEDGKEVWGQLEKITAYGYSRSDVFSDWLDLFLDSHLSLTDNIRRGNTDPLKFDGIYNERYLKTANKYKRDGKIGTRPIDYLANACGLLIAETLAKRSDILGTIYEERITYGEHGQYFTPQPIAAMLASIVATDGVSVSDPAGCGSGRMLLAAAKTSPNAKMHGVDRDQCCAKITTLNMMLFDLNAEIVWGDGLSDEWYRKWRVLKGGWIVEIDPPKR
jgi:type I restriction-modification system DNA methylase subunit